MKALCTWPILLVVAALGISISGIGLHLINTIHVPQEKVMFKPLEREPFTILFLGDVMLDRTLRLRGEEKGYDYIFKCVKDIFNQYDEVVINLEGTVTDYPSISKNALYLSPESFRFTFDPVALDAAVAAGVTVFGLDNNHIFDFGIEGIIQTIQNLERHHVSFFGNPLDDEISHSQQIVHLQKQSVPTQVTLIPFNEFFGDEEVTVKHILRERIENPNHYLVVVAHWGDEYVEPPPRVRAWAHQFIDSGADLVIGMHPHIIQESEEYKNKKIYYSLGNFIFDQYWEESVRTGLGVGLTLDADGRPVFEEIIFDIDRTGQTCPREKVVI